jgi:hypothetical protein
MALNTRSRNLLRLTIQGILSEDAGPGKSMELVRKLEALNANLKAIGSDLVAGVQITGPGDKVEITFAVKMSKAQGISIVALPDNSNDYPPSVTSRLPPRSDIHLPLGSIMIGRPSAAHAGSCAGSWVVKFVDQTTKGWGPLLYDLAMETAGAAGAALMPDREIVSYDARGVWRKYDTARSDVEKEQLDVDLELSPKRSDVDYGEQITPDDPFDDCVQQSAADDEDVEGMPPPRSRLLRLPGSRRRSADSTDDKPAFASGSWQNSPLSRAYRKSSPTVTKALEAAGLLWR